MKKLARSRDNKMIFGVLGGIGEYLRLDPTLLRLVVVILSIFTMVFPVLLVYLAAGIIMPENKG